MPMSVRLSATEDRLVLRDLHQSGGTINLYELHKRYRLSPGQIFSACEKLRTMGLAERNGLTLQETEKGFAYCVTAAHDIWTAVDQPEWKSIPEKIKPRSEVGAALYCPRSWAKGAQNNPTDK